MRAAERTVSRCRRRIGPADGIPVVLIHGNLSTGRFYEHLFADAPASYRLLAPDMRGFGDTERVPIDATRGLRDWADDTHALLQALGIDAPPHLVGWSHGRRGDRRVCARSARRLADLHRPRRPVRLRRDQARRHAALLRLRGLRRRHRQPEFTARLAAGDRSHGTRPAQRHEQLLLAPGRTASRRSARRCCSARS